MSHHSHQSVYDHSSSTSHVPYFTHPSPSLSSHRYLPFYSPMEALERGLNTKYCQQEAAVNMEDGECSSEPGEEEYETGCARANFPYYPSLSQISDVDQCSEMESSDETPIAIGSLQTAAAVSASASSGALQDNDESLKVTSLTDEEEIVCTTKDGEVNKDPSVSLAGNRLHNELKQEELEDEVDEQIQKEAEKRNAKETEQTPALSCEETLTTVSTEETISAVSTKETPSAEGTVSTEPMEIHAMSESQAFILQDLYATRPPVEIRRISESQAALLKDLIAGKKVRAMPISQAVNTRPVGVRATSKSQAVNTRPVGVHAASESQTATTRPVGVCAASESQAVTSENTESQAATAKPVDVRAISESQAVLLNDMCAHHTVLNMHKPPVHKQGIEEEEEMEVEGISHCERRSQSRSLSPPSPSPSLPSHSPDLFDSADSSDSNDIPVIDDEQLELLKGIKGWKLNKSIGFIRLDARRVVHQSSVTQFNAPPITKVWLHNLTFKNSKLEFSAKTITGNGLMRQRRDDTPLIAENQSQEEEAAVEIYSYQSQEEPEQKVFDRLKVHEGQEERWRVGLPHFSQERTELTLTSQSHSGCEDQTGRVQAECASDSGGQSQEDLPSGSDLFDHKLLAMAGSGSSGGYNGTLTSSEDENRRCKRPRTEKDRDSQLQPTNTSSEPYSLTPYQRPAEPSSPANTQPHNSTQSLFPPMPSKVASIIQGYWYMQKLQTRKKAAKV